MGKEEKPLSQDKLEQAIAAINAEQLIGATSDHVVVVSTADSEKVKLQPLVVEAYTNMREAALRAGFELQIASGFRDFQRQQAIWTKKLAASNESERALEKILHWSALPGTSRHHWGTEFDFFDAHGFSSQEGTEKKLQLVANEYEPGGPCYKLYQWLQDHAGQFGFYWPYKGRGNGVAAEPWHLSYAPLASHYQALWQQPESVIYLGEVLRAQNLLGLPLVASRLQNIIQRYSLQVETPPVEATK